MNSVNPMPGLTPAEDRSWQQFLDSALRMYAAMNRALVDRHQLTLNDVRLLDVLATAPDERARMGDVAEALMSLPSRVTRQIDRLEKQGLVSRSHSSRDGRAVIAVLTDAGRAVLEDAKHTYGDGVKTNFAARLTRAQVTALGESCRRISHGLQADGSPARLGRV